MILADEAATAALGEQIARCLRKGDAVTLSGPLGVGKTALARAILKGLGHDGEVPSPTFAIVQPYDHLPLPAWHADLFRIEEPEELDEIGLSVAADGVLIVEWPERAAGWPGALALTLQFAPNDGRRLTADVPASWQDRWPPR